MNIQQAANQLAELGHVTRLSLYRLLVKAGREGLEVAQLQQRLQVPGSTLSHHISRLVKVGLVKQIREGRVLHCVAQYDKLDKLLSFLVEECCKQPVDEDCC